MSQSFRAPASGPAPLFVRRPHNPRPAQSRCPDCLPYEQPADNAPAQSSGSLPWCNLQPASAYVPAGSASGYKGHTSDPCLPLRSYGSHIFHWEGLPHGHNARLQCSLLRFPGSAEGETPTSHSGYRQCRDSVSCHADTPPRNSQSPSSEIPDENS